MTKCNFNVTYSNPQDQKLIYEFGKEMSFDFKRMGRKSNRDKSRIDLLKSPAIMASRIPKLFLPEKN